MQLSDILRAFVGQNNMAVSTTDSSVSVQNNQLLRQFMKALTPGQIISGEVMEVSGDALKLLVSQDGEQFTLQAKLDQNIALTQGKSVLFQVKNNGSSLALSPLYENTSMEKTATLALEQANIPVTEATLALTGTLMKEGMPVDKESLTTMYNQVLQHGEEQLSNIVDLHKLGLPVNETNLEQMDSYKNMTHQLVQGMEQFSRELPRILGNLVSENKEDVATQLLKAVLEPLLPEGKEGGVFTSGQENIPEEASKEPVQVVIKDSTVSTPATAETLPINLQTGESGVDLLKSVFNLLQKGEQIPIKELVKSEEFSVALKQLIEQELLVSPEETTKEKIKELYSKLGKQLQAVSEALDNTALLETDLGRNVTQMNHNVNFLNQLNQMYAYIQLPLKLAGNEAHGELYVYSNKKRLSSADGEISALLHLDMEHLGPVDVYVAMQYEKVSTQFYLQDDEMLDFINVHMDMLTKRLQDRGYDISVTTSVRKTEGENSCMKELLKEHSNIPLLSTDSFDARV